MRRTRTHDVPSAGQGASALLPSQSRRGIAAPIYFFLIAAVVVALTQATVVPAATAPQAAPSGAASISWADTGLAALRGSTTTTTAPPVAPTTTTTSSTPSPPPPSTTLPAPPPPPPPAAAPALPARGQATAWGCDAALAYLRAYAAPGFTLDCPGNAEGHQGMTCFNEPGNCPNRAIIAIAVPCPQSYMNEASNSLVLTGRSNAPIDPYGSCP